MIWTMVESHDKTNPGIYILMLNESTVFCISVWLYVLAQLDKLLWYIEVEEEYLDHKLLIKKK